MQDIIELDVKNIWQRNSHKAMVKFYLMLIAVMLLLLALFASTVQSIVSVWWHSETFSHGFLIVPISIGLVWRKRAELADVYSPVTVLPMLLAAPLALVWLLANVVGLQVVEQIAFVMICIVTLWSMLGHARSGILWFPLCFLFFAAPVGDELVPLLMEVTADFTVALISASGIPVYREGLYFSLPSGNWSVVEACSGIRYLIASVMMCVLYSYLTFKSLWASFIFIVLSVVVPILANGFRAYGIVMLGHYSDMKLATGVDHLFYGWLFFGFIMFLLFSFGQILKGIFEKENENTLIDIATDPSAIEPSRNITTYSKSNTYKVFAIIAMISFWPGFARYISAHSSQWPEVNIIEAVANQADSTGQWSTVLDDVSSWKPEYEGYDTTSSASYLGNENAIVKLTILTYQFQHQGKELIRNQNVLVTPNSDDWKIISTRVVQPELTEKSVDVFESRLKSRDQNLIVWHWNVIDGQVLIDPIKGKMYEAKNKILLDEKPSFAFFLVVEDEGDSSTLSLSTFYQLMYPRFQSVINDQITLR